MTSTQTIRPDARWTRAMERSQATGKPTRQPDGNFRVPSLSRPGTYRTVSVTDGKITGCTCPGWRSRSAPCRHAGAVAVAMAFLAGASIVPQRREVEPYPVDSQRSRRQLFRQETAR